MDNAWAGKSVLVTGVSGTVGQEILKQLLALGAARVTGIDHNESALFFQEQSHAACDNVRFFLCDVTDRHSLEMRMRGHDIVIHCAALKHVPLCEHSPRSAVATNIEGVQNIIDAAFKAKVQRVLFTSSDKAVNPTNVMGTTKLMGERLVTAANATRQASDDPVFGVTRFGNVLGSSGSVMQVFRNQIAAGQDITLTHEDMTRFVMTLEQAAGLVLRSALMFRGGEVFITKMPVMRIIDLAHVMIEELSPVYGHAAGKIGIRLTGLRPGEKMYEELISTEEVRRTLETDDFFVVCPALAEDASVYKYPGVETRRAALPYTSDNSPAMGRDEIRAYLHEGGLLEGAQRPQQQPKMKVVKA